MLIVLILLVAVCGWAQTTAYCGGYGLAEASVHVVSEYACISRGDTVSACTAMRVAGGNHELAIENNGNLAVYNADSMVKWTSRSSGRVSSDTRLQYSTNGVVQMISGGRVVWSLQSAGSDGLFCVNTENGQLALYDVVNDELITIWESTTEKYGAGYPKPGQTTTVKVYTTTDVVLRTTQPSPSLFLSPPPSQSPSPPTIPESATKAPSESSGLSVGAIVGISVGATALLAGAAFLLYHRRVQNPKLPQYAEQLQPLSSFAPAGVPASSLEHRVTEMPVVPIASGSEWYRANSDYFAQVEGELTIQRGDLVEVIGKREDGLWRGRVRRETGAEVGRETGSEPFYWVKSSTLDRVA
ncbi:hypothetical protein BDR26DRAFT_1005879 [Obelidium mucronatum]|nr:hypothetical protein BDR26DRAFT_1005879 [Obelidium mucronatum]